MRFEKVACHVHIICTCLLLSDWNDKLPLQLLYFLFYLCIYLFLLRPTKNTQKSYPLILHLKKNISILLGKMIK